MLLPDLFETALTAILKASAEIMKIYGENQLNITLKKDASPVTQADLKSSDIICTHLEKTGIPIICEETASTAYHIRKKWEYFWLVDPLDGTKEFISRNGEFTVNIALISNRKPILGLISVPAQGLLYWGIQEMGAYKIDFSSIEETNYKSVKDRATVLPCFDKGPNTRVVVSRSHLDENTLKYLKNLAEKGMCVEQISVGSALKFCYIAEGKADIYLRYSPTMEWDTAAGQAITEASGAQMTKFPYRKVFLYNKKKLVNQGFIVSRNPLG